MIDDIFRTKQGVYQRDTDTGLFTIKDRVSTPKLFVGSVDPISEIQVRENKFLSLKDIPVRLQPEALFYGLIDRGVDKFSPDFVEGHLPFAVVCPPTDIESVSETQLTLKPEFGRRVDLGDSNVQIGLGSKIEEVYHQLTDHERGYTVLR